jgi:hypothetical protein
MQKISIAEFVKDLHDITSDHGGKSLHEYKRLLVIANRAGELIHGSRSDHAMNYRPMAIETELSHTINKLRVLMLNKMLETLDELKKDDLKDCWQNFDIAHRLNYGELTADDSGWSGDELAPKVKDALFPIVLDKITERLHSRLSKDERLRTLKMLNGLHSRYNHSHKNYLIAGNLLAIMDTKKQIGSMDFV